MLHVNEKYFTSHNQSAKDNFWQKNNLKNATSLCANLGKTLEYLKITQALEHSEGTWSLGHSEGTRRVIRVLEHFRVLGHLRHFIEQARLKSVPPKCMDLTITNTKSPFMESCTRLRAVYQIIIRQ